MLGSRLSNRPQERPTCPWSIRHCRPWLLRCLRVRGRAGPIPAEQQEGTSLVATAVDAGSPADPTGRRTDPHVCGRCGVSEPGLCCAVGFQVKPGRSTQNSRRRDRPCRCVSGCWGPGYPTDHRKDPLVRDRSGGPGPSFCEAVGSRVQPRRSTHNSRMDQPCCYGSGRWESC